MFIHIIIIQIFLFENLHGKVQNKDPLLCQKQKNCDSCMQVSSHCRWCSKADFPYRRCNTQEYLIKQNCEEEILNYPSIVTNNLTSKLTPYYIVSPATATIYFRPYDTLELNIDVTITENSPVETAIVLDFSRSMTNVFNDLLAKVQEITVEGLKKGITRIGVTKFVDKGSFPILYFWNVNFLNHSQSDQFYFSIIHPLSSDSESIVNALKVEELSLNYDFKEAVLDGIVQTALCDQMNWSSDENVIRSIVAITDDVPKIQGDALNIGVFRPHDLKCHLKGQEKTDWDGLDFDYPSVAQTGHALRMNKMEIILAVDSKTKPYYEKIADSWKGVKSIVSDMDFKNVDLLNLILQTREDLNSKIAVTAQPLNEFQISISAKCTNYTNDICNDVKIGDINKFIINMTNQKLFEEEKKFNLIISSLYLLPINIKRIEECECSKTFQISGFCNGHGKMSCGGCMCDSNWGGKDCSCDKTSVNSEYACKNPETRQICSGNGECNECGNCSCYTADDGLPFGGEFCECNRKNCQYFDGKICGGEERGKCECNTCVCDTMYEGKACEQINCKASIFTSQCTNLDDNLICSGIGVCNCGNCECPLNKTGIFCQTDVLEIDCSTFEADAFCFHGIKESDDIKKCDKENVKLETGDDKQYKCMRINPENCKVFFNFQELSSKIYQVYVKPLSQTKDCIKPLNVGILTGSIFAGLIFLGFGAIGIYFLILYLYYLADYNKFQKELAKQSLGQANPIFMAEKGDIIS